MASDLPEDLEEFRAFLRILAEMQLNPRYRVREDVSDIVQLTLLKAHQDRAAFRGRTRGELRSWLKTIFLHTLVNSIKRHQAQRRDLRVQRSLDEQLDRSSAMFLPPSDPRHRSPSEVAMQAEEKERLAEALSRLLPGEREAVLLKHIHHWTVAEIAVHMNRSKQGVSGLLARGLAKLRRLMSESDGD